MHAYIGDSDEEETEAEKWSNIELGLGKTASYLAEGHASPFSDVIVPTAEPCVGLPSRPSDTSIPHICLNEDLKPTDGVPIKPTVVKDARHIKCKAVRQLLYSMLRNGMCWLLLACVIIISLGDGGSIKDWFNDGRVSVIVLLIVGLLGIPFQAVHAAREMRNRRPSLLACMLRQMRDVKDFKELIRDRQLCPPYLAVEMSLKSGAVAQAKKEGDNWMVTTRKNIKVLDLNTWLDVSSPIEDQHWEDLGSFWVILSKEYRFLDKKVEKATQDDVAQFKRDCQYDKYSYFMDFQYVLDVQEGDYFPDAQACLVWRNNKPVLYNMTTYKVCLCLALDMFYQMLFYLVTKRAQDYYFVKFIER